ncbi:MAG TPA: TIGR04282 family arsenosugar biosynthesis glycosyltransferase [Candidatus Krumholzibacteria bacterium]|nr:TIGR04282 family arsenosugar biosynthesis glycosyltransferase [Candidatus Krumholzibacteria bacterium]HPD70879.1 TIGR04282 family arsenosugar biosynthesis glycosyltransferase [Candidatus Krumholzibacteria bacterium]HRY39421.1 TIGR04282 family arsenosugar biosynthesis glycosyltransferase [Candidatus Krumholzibacteria bacterium]
MPDHLILMTRYPRVGQSKARFIPALGADGAARLQRKLTERAVATARAWRSAGPARRACVACEGATIGEYRDWLGDDLDYEAHSGGSLGARMAVASVRAFSQGADRVVLAGVDCPELDAIQLARAFFALDHADCVIGPSRNGAYYLIGLVAPAPALFAGIPWGTGAVLSRTLAAMRQDKLRVGVMPELPVLGGPGDLIHAASLLEEHPLADPVR